MDPQEYKRTSLESWNTMASGWERRRTFLEEVTRPVAEWMVQALDPQPGETILELAAGPGSTGFAAAAQLGGEGRLISTDFSPEMVEVARRRAVELGLTNVEHRVADAERLELEDAAVDGVLCRFGYMLMPDPGSALRETRRVLRPDGRLVLATWRGPEQNPWVALAGRVLVARGLVPPPQPDEPGMFTMATDERVQSLLEDAGFTSIQLEDVPVRFRYGDIHEYVELANDTGGTFRRAFAHASEEERREITQELAEAYAPFATNGGYEVPGAALCALAR